MARHQASDRQDKQHLRNAVKHRFSRHSPSPYHGETLFRIFDIFPVVERVFPNQARKPGEIAIRGHPPASVLERQRRQIGILHHAAAAVGFAAQSKEKVPMMIAGPQGYRRGSGDERFDILGDRKTAAKALTNLRWPDLLRNP